MHHHLRDTPTQAHNAVMRVPALRPVRGPSHSIGGQEYGSQGPPVEKSMRLWLWLMLWFIQSAWHGKGSDDKQESKQ